METCLTKNIFFLLGGVVYEDPWLAGGHNGLSNSEDPELPQAPFERVVELRSFMNEIGLSETPMHTLLKHSCSLA